MKERFRINGVLLKIWNGCGFEELRLEIAYLDCIKCRLNKYSKHQFNLRCQLTYSLTSNKRKKNCSSNNIMN